MRTVPVLALVATLAIMAVPHEATAAPPGFDQLAADVLISPVDQVASFDLEQLVEVSQAIEIEQLVEVRTIEFETFVTASVVDVAEKLWRPPNYIDDDAIRLRAMTIDPARMQSISDMASPDGPLLCLTTRTPTRFGAIHRRGDRGTGISKRSSQG